MPIPDEVSDDQAAGVLLQGLTAWALLRISARLERGRERRRPGRRRRHRHARRPARQALRGRPGDRARLDARRSATSRSGSAPTPPSTPASEDLAAAILEANGGEQVDVVLEMSGGATFDACLSVLAPFGRLVTFGIASRQPNEVMHAEADADEPRRRRLLARPPASAAPICSSRGSPSCSKRSASGKLEVVIGATYGLSDVADAHRALQGRETQGKLLLDPSQ